MKKLLITVMSFLLVVSICGCSSGESGLKPVFKDKKIITKTRTDSSGEYTMFYEYDGKGNCVHELGVVSNFGTAGYKIDGGYEVIRSYDENGLLMKETKYIETGKIAQATCSYDSNGNLLERREETNSGATKYIYTYDANNNKLTQDFQSSTGEITSSVKYYYENGRLIRSVSESPYFKATTSLYEYDSQGNLVRLTIDGEEREKDTYNDKWLVSESLQYQFGEWVKFIYEYDSDGNLVTEAKYDASDKLLFSLDYKYDYIYDTIDNPKPVYPKEYIINKDSDPKIGMTASEVVKTKWGEPSYKNITETKYGVHEQWVYRNKGYIYLDNGVVTGIQYRE